MKPKPLTEAQFLTLLERVLSKLVARDMNLRAAIQDEVSKEIRLHNNVASFTKFCEQGAVPDLKPETVAELQEQLAATFGEAATVTVTPDEARGGLMDVEISLPDRTVTSQVKVDPDAAAKAASEEAPKVPFVPFPVTLPTDAELVWVLARREDLGPDEAARALASIEEEFWATKAGQKRLKEGAERTFADFIAAVPAAALLESGLKRHYKEPETLHALRQLGGSTGGGGDIVAELGGSSGAGASSGGGRRRDESLDALFDEGIPENTRAETAKADTTRKTTAETTVKTTEEPVSHGKGAPDEADGDTDENEAPWD